MAHARGQYRHLSAVHTASALVSGTENPSSLTVPTASTTATKGDPVGKTDFILVPHDGGLIAKLHGSSGCMAMRLGCRHWL